jgi:hypothetical protein
MATNNRRLSPEEIRLVLTSSESLNTLARQLGKSKQALSQIRLGRTHQKMFPELPRRNLYGSCYFCRYWRGGLDPCSQGVPDPVEEGPRFGADCDHFRLKAD